MIEFLSTLWAGSTGYGELRFLGRKPHQEFFKLEDPYALGHVEQQARRYSEDGQDVYFGVLPRRSARGTADAVTNNPYVLWADVDAKGRTQSGCFVALGKITVPPAIIVDSGHGYHAYWLLDNGGVPWEQARLAMKGIAFVVGGDAVYDKARVLRVPGTKNWKVGVNIDHGKDVRLVRFDPVGNYHPFSDFAAYVDIGADLERPAWMPPRRVFVHTSPRDGVKRDVPWTLLEKMMTDPGKGLRSEHVFSIVCGLLELGYDGGEIEDLIRQYPQGVGVKYFEKGARAHDWLGYSIREAQRRVGW